MTGNIVNKKYFFAISEKKISNCSKSFGSVKIPYGLELHLYTILNNREMENEFQGPVYGHLKV